MVLNRIRQYQINIAWKAVSFQPLGAARMPNETVNLETELQYTLKMKIEEFLTAAI